ncbi:hypothetical protein [Actinoallomurus rhizosphaericola]|uniref:hypothetical protein n=1 Tax=Actinoallomurus rhizosphaericola TaxID=2952536 RepID=UPI0020902E4D|nr:hypothetical protein [Actinoallomurus rhizosphaericola]MCO5992989.1 hypothetical protein [Actinoallomurus rhizosphaericola]
MGFGLQHRPAPESPGNREKLLGIIADTQIVSYIMKGSPAAGDLSGFSITSTVAQEFLRVRDIATGNTRYFTPPPYSLSPRAKAAYETQEKIYRDHPRDKPLFKRVTDKIVFDFNNEFPSVMEYGHVGISHLINTQNRTIFSQSLSHLPKPERKDLMNKFSFLAEQGIDCIPIQPESISIAFDFLKLLIKRGVNLKGDFRNSLNDMLILGTAVANESDLWTEDKILAQFAEDEGISKIKSHRGHFEISINEPNIADRRVSRESKGYINTAWRYAIHQPPAPDAPSFRRQR